MSQRVWWQAHLEKSHLNWRFIDWIWRVRGSVSLASQQRNDDTLDRLSPLFNQVGTSYERSGDIITFTKKDQAAQDKMSVFDAGILRVENDSAGSVLRYDLTSRVLLLCFLSIFLFGVLGKVNDLHTRYVKRHHVEAKAAHEKPPDKHHKDVVKIEALPQSPIDKALGAPAPERPKKKGDKSEKKSMSSTTAYFFAVTFFGLYLVGRILEDRLVRSLFRRQLLEPAASS